MKIANRLPSREDRIGVDLAEHGDPDSCCAHGRVKVGSRGKLAVEPRERLAP